MNLSSNNTTNGSVVNNTGRLRHGYGERKANFEIAYDSCLIVLALFIIAINVLVPALFLRNRGLRTKTNMLLVSLAIADMVMGLVGIPMYISCNTLYMFFEYRGMCFAANVVYRFIAVSTIFHIFAITIERYISVSYPFNYVTWVKMSRLRMIIASIWILSLFMALVQLSLQDLTKDYYMEDEGEVDPFLYRAGLIYNLIGVIVCFTIPLTIMIFIYWRMFVIIRTQIKRIKQQNVTGFEENCKPLSSERRAITIFALMLGFFTTCWLTWYLSLLANYINVVMYVPELVYEIFDFLRFSTSFINPLLYTFLKSDFRRALFRLVSSKFGRNRNKQSFTTDATVALTTAVHNKNSNGDTDDETKKLTSI